MLELYPFLRFSWIWLYFITIPELIEIYWASVIKFTSNESTKSERRVVKGPFHRWFYFSSITRMLLMKKIAEQGEKTRQKYHTWLHSFMINIQDFRLRDPWIESFWLHSLLLSNSLNSLKVYYGKKLKESDSVTHQNAVLSRQFVCKCFDL